MGHVGEDHQRSSGIRPTHSTPNKTAKQSGIEKKDLESCLFHFNYFACLRHPLGAYLNPNPVLPAYLAAKNDDQGHQKGIPSSLWVHKTRTNPPHANPLPPLHGLPRPRSDPRDVDGVSMGRADRSSSIAPTGLRRRNGPRRIDVRTPPPRVSRSRTVSTASRLHTAHSDNAPKAEKAEKKGDRRGAGTPDRQTKTQTEAY